MYKTIVLQLSVLVAQQSCTPLPPIVRNSIPLNKKKTLKEESGK